MELFRGDSFVKEITSDDYEFEPGDIIVIAVMRSAYSKKYLHKEVIKIQEATNSVTFEIEPAKTSEFPIDDLLLEIEITTVTGIVQTEQYVLNVKADGIYERN